MQRAAITLMQRPGFSGFCQIAILASSLLSRQNMKIDSECASMAVPGAMGLMQRAAIIIAAP